MWLYEKISSEFGGPEVCTPPGPSRECGQAAEMGAAGVTLEKSE